MKSSGIIFEARTFDGYIDALTFLSHINSDPAGFAANDYAMTKGVYGE